MQKQYFEDDLQEFRYESVSDGIKIIAYTGAKDAVKLPSVIDGKPVVEIGFQSDLTQNDSFSAFIPSSVKRIEFSDNSGDSYYNRTKHWLRSSELDDENPYLRFENGFLIQGEKLLYCTDCVSEKIIIPDGIVSIGSFAFKSCSQLSEIIFPESLKEIESYAFLGRTLKNVELPSGLESIGYMAFPIPSQKLKISIPTSVKNFAANNGIIPLGLENNENFTICDGFLLTPDKKTILRYVGEPITELFIPDYVENIAPDACNVEALQNLKKLTLGASLKKIGENAFSDTKVKSLKITPVLEEIGEDAFDFANFSSLSIDKKNRSFFTDKNALYKILDGGKMELITCFRKKIEEYTVAENTVTIWNGAFDGCSLLGNLILPDSLTEFSEYSIDKSLKKIRIPKSVENIVFSGRRTSMQYEIDTENPFYVLENHVLYKKAENGLIAVKSKGNEEEISLLPGTVSVAPHAFVGTYQKIVLPESVKRIEHHAFSNIQLKNIILNEGLLYIDCFAFENTDLQTVNLPASLQYISSTAFSFSQLSKYTIAEGNENYSVYDDALFSKDGTILYDVPNKKISAEFSVPAQTTEICRAFRNCEKIKAIRLPQGVKNIWNSAMKNCGALKDIYLEKSTDYINANFVDYHASVNLHVSSDSPIAKMMIQAVDEGYKRRNLRLACTDIPNLHNDFYLLPNPSGFTIAGYISEEKNPKIPSEIGGRKITAIGSYAFEGTKIETVELPDTIETIGKKAFYSCYDLKSIVLPKGLKVLSASMFNYCRKLEELEIPDGTERVEDGVFFGCENLTKVSFPKSVSHIGEWIFSRDDEDTHREGERYKDLYLDTRKTTFLVSKDSYAEKFLRAYQSESYTGEKLTVIYDSAVSNSTETKEDTEALRYLDYTVQEDGTVAVQLKSLYGDEQAPSRIRIPQTVKGMPVTTLNLIRIYKSLETIEVPASVVSIKAISDSHHFYTANLSIKEIKVAEENPAYFSDGQALYTKDGSTLLHIFDYQTETYCVRENTKIIKECAFTNHCILKKLILPTGLQEIQNKAFDRCHSLAEIEGIKAVPSVASNALINTAYYKNSAVVFSGTVLQKYADTTKTRYEIPEGTTEIASGAFSLSNPNGDILEEIVLPSSVRKIGSYAFSGRTVLKTIRLSEGVERIETHAFYQCFSLEMLYIPASVNFIEPYAFPLYDKDWVKVFIPKLSAIEVNENNETFKSVDGILYSKDGKTLIHVPASHSISVFEAPEGLEEIGKDSFRGNQTLKKVILHSGVTRIGKNAFYRCESLEEAIVNAQEIGDYAFRACEKLNRLSLKQTKIIGKNAFEECLQLGNIALPDGLTQIGERAFKDCGMTDITVPKTVLKTENESFSGCPRITVYDTIDPEAKPCEEFLDDVNGYPNSTVGFIGIGPSHAMWQCAANHHWVDHEIIVRSAETDEIKYKIPMVSDPKQRMYYCTLTSSWGKNATFHFAALDNIFSKIKGVTIKLNVALTRLRYPINLSASQKKVYENYLVRSAKDLVALCIDSDDMETLILCEPFGILKKDNIDALIDYAAKANAVTFSAYLMNYKNEKFGFIEPKLPSLSFKEPELWAFSKSNPGKIGRYKGFETEITFPSEWKGSSVTGVASTTSKVPENYLAITSVVLPEGYTSIGDYAFYGCVNLEKITLPSTLQTIGKDAFHGCKKLKEIIMPDSLTTIGENAFSYCSALKNVRFSERLTHIPTYAFYYCNQLEEIDLPERVQWLEKGCFETLGLKKLTVRCERLQANGKCFGSKPSVYVYHKDAVKDVYGITKSSVHLIGEEKASKEEIPPRKNSGIWEFSSVDSITFQDKIFVLSGFGADEEATITAKIQSLGGIVKSSTVVKTDYLIVMEEYNRSTTKYQKAKELQEKGKDLAIISSSAFYAFVKNT